jgi:thymidylate kinase
MHFINIDGPNKVGKSTFIKNLVKELEETTSLKIYMQHFHRRETLVGETIQKVLNGEYKVDSLALQKLYSVDRLDFTNVQYKQLEEEGYDLLITDRYHTSGLAYGFASGVDTDTIVEFDKYCVKPELNIILMADYPTLLARSQVLNEGETGDIFEEDKKLAKALAGYCMVPTVVANCITLNVSNGTGEYLENVVDVCKGVCKHGDMGKFIHNLIND